MQGAAGAQNTECIAAVLRSTIQAFEFFSLVDTRCGCHVNYSRSAPDALIEWLTPLHAELAGVLASPDEQERRSGWERLGSWLGSQALTIPANVVGSIIGTMLLSV